MPCAVLVAHRVGIRHLALNARLGRVHAHLLAKHLRANAWGQMCPKHSPQGIILRGRL